MEHDLRSSEVADQTSWKRGNPLVEPLGHCHMTIRRHSQSTTSTPAEAPQPAARELSSCWMVCAGAFPAAGAGGEGKRGGVARAFEKQDTGYRLATVWLPSGHRLATL